MMDMIRRRPWILVILGIALMASLTIAFVTIAVLNPPQAIR